MNFSSAYSTVDLRFILFVSPFTSARLHRDCFFSVEASLVKKAWGAFPSARWSMNWCHGHFRLPLSHAVHVLVSLCLRINPTACQKSGLRNLSSSGIFFSSLHLL